MRKGLLLATVLIGMNTVILSASTMGSFNLSGDIILNGTSSVTWTSFSGVADQALISDATGIYSGLDNQMVTIESLNSTTEPTNAPGATGQGFADALFIVFPASSGLGSLDINTIFGGIDSSAGCTAAPTTLLPLSVCTPTLLSGGSSPWNFQNDPPPNAITSTMTFAVAGDVADASGDTFSANFTLPFNVPFQTLLSELGPDQNMSVEDAYSANFTVTGGSSTPVPENSSLSMLGLGLGFVVAFRLKGRLALRSRS